MLLRQCAAASLCTVGLKIEKEEKKLARALYREFVAAGIKLGHRKEFYLADEGRILGSEEFVDTTIHRIGETKPSRTSGKKLAKQLSEFDADALIQAVEKISGLTKEDFCGPGKNSALINAKEALILVGRQAGASGKMLSEVSGISSSAVSRRHDAARIKMRHDREMRKLVDTIEKQYLGRG